MLVQVENCAEAYCLSVTQFSGGESIIYQYDVCMSVFC